MKNRNKTTKRTRILFSKTCYFIKIFSKIYKSSKRKNLKKFKKFFEIAVSYKKFKKYFKRKNF